MRRCILLTIAAVLVTQAVLALAFVYSGLYAISARTPHTQFGWWLLTTAKQRAVQRSAANIQAPALEGEHWLERGRQLYAARCVQCHGAPGIGPEGVGVGVYPPAPFLLESRDKWSRAELFWIIKYGIKMTAMPAWQPTEDENDLWALVAFVEHLPELTAAGYRAMSPPAAPAGARSP